MPPRASRSQKGAASQRRSKRQTIDDDDPEDEEEEDQGDEDGDVDMDNNQNETYRKANELVRLALFVEHKRTPIRRDEITKKVLGANNKSFNAVFAQAQEILKSRFGMELIELKTRAALGADGDAELEDARKATGVKRKSAATGSKTWIVRSTLDSDLIAQAAIPHKAIKKAEEEDAGPVEDQDPDWVTKCYGSIISWNHTDSLGPLGVLYTILALILVSGRVISDMDLRTNLKRLRLTPTDLINLPPHSPHSTIATESYLSQLIRQNFLDRSNIGDTGAKGKGAGKKRGRGNDDDTNVANTFEWRWGTRAHAEIGELGIAQFVAAFMVGDTADHDEDGPDGESDNAKRKRVAAKMEKGMEKTLQEISRAAGGSLVE